MQRTFRYVPFVRNLKIRTIIGFILLVLSAISSTTIASRGRVEIIGLIYAIAWILAVFLTDKYVHKYPQRYFTYLIASHLKAAIIMAFLVWLCGSFAGPAAAPPVVLWAGYLGFIFLDALVSVPRRRDRRYRPSHTAVPEGVADDPRDREYSNAVSYSIDPQAVIRQIRTDLHRPFVEFIEKNLPCLQGGSSDVLVLDDIPAAKDPAKSAAIDLLVGRTRINDVLRLNRFMLFCAGRIRMRGYFVIRYMPLENATIKLKSRYRGVLYRPAFILHYIWYRAIPNIPWLDTLYFSSKLSWLDAIHLSLVKKRNRVLSKAEVWGRLAYCGMRVIAESAADDERYLIAQRVAFPIGGKRPSYYPVVALEKVGLDGEIIYAHKIRTMFPFSEFLQKRIFEDHGLDSTGKFSNDFRLTEIGKFLRKYWLDELPQIFDWLRGDIKLVGMRATSRHFLSLYPQEVYEHYVQIKPGLIPPIFDESTTGFDKIVEIELTYLRSYWMQPFRTDVRCLIQTFTDIVFKGVRSR